MVQRILNCFFIYYGFDRKAVAISDEGYSDGINVRYSFNSVFYKLHDRMN